MSGERAVSPVVGFVLLVGLAAVGAMTLFAVSVAVTDDTASSIEKEQVGHSMAQLAASANDLAIGESETTEFSIDANEDAIVTADGESGNINVTLRLEDAEDVVLVPDRPLGKIEYRMGDGTTFAYQGGGVWRHDSDREPEMVDPPNFEYRAGPRQEPTLTFSFVRIGDGEPIDDGSGRISVQEQIRHYPNATERRMNPMGEGTVRISIESEYCEAWKDHFTQRTTGTIDKSCNEGTGSEIIVELIVPEQLIDGIEHAAIVSDPDNVKKGNNAGDIDGGEAYGELSSPTDEINRRVAAVENWKTPETVDRSLNGSGVFNITKIDSEEDWKIVADEGDIEVVLRDGVDIDGNNLTVSGDHDVWIYVNEGKRLNIKDGDVGNEGDPSQTTLYVHSDVDEVNVKSSSTVWGIIYAPNSEINVGGGGKDDSYIVGSAISDLLHLQGDNTKIKYDPSIEEKTLEAVVPDERRRIYYLHVSETTVVVAD